MWEMILWGILFIVLIILESVTAQMISIWFAVGALAAFITSLFTNNIMVEISVFLAASILLLVATRPIVKKASVHKMETTNAADSSIGQVGLVTEEIDNLEGRGRIQLNGLSWNARSENQQPIHKGTEVVVRRIEGVTAFVTPVDQQS